MTVINAGASLALQTTDQLPDTAVFSLPKALTTKLTVLVIATLWLGACASAPVQEMSDARQAIRSAEAVGAAERSPNNFMASRRLLFEAQRQLRSGAYDTAKRLALEARDQAIKAREKALQPNPVGLAPP